MAVNVSINNRSKAKATTSALRVSQGGDASPRPEASQGAQLLTPSPSHSAILPRPYGSPSTPRSMGTASLAGPCGGDPPDPSFTSAQTSSPESFWRLLPVSEGLRRNPAMADDGPADTADAAAPPPSWLASTPSSMETVKNSRTPLTPFQPWDSGSNYENGVSETEEAQGIHPVDVSIPRNLYLQRRCALNTAIHGVILVGQIIVTVAVTSVLITIAVWKKGTTQARFWDM